MTAKKRVAFSREINNESCTDFKGWFDCCVLGKGIVKFLIAVYISVDVWVAKYRSVLQSLAHTESRSEGGSIKH